MFKKILIIFIFILGFKSNAHLSPRPNCPKELQLYSDFRSSELWRDNGNCVSLEEVARNMLVYIKACGVFDIKPRTYSAYTYKKFSPINQNIIDLFEFDPLYKKYCFKSNLSDDDIYSELFTSVENNDFDKGSLLLSDSELAHTTDAQHTSIIQLQSFCDGGVAEVIVDDLL